MRYRCNRLSCPLARLSGLQCINMGHNGHALNLYGVVMILIGNLHADGQSNLGHLSLVHRNQIEFFVPLISGGSLKFVPHVPYAYHVAYQ